MLLSYTTSCSTLYAGDDDDERGLPAWTLSQSRSSRFLGRSTSIRSMQAGRMSVDLSNPQAAAADYDSSPSPQALMGLASRGAVSLDLVRPPPMYQSMAAGAPSGRSTSPFVAAVGRPESNYPSPHPIRPISNASASTSAFLASDVPSRENSCASNAVFGSAFYQPTSVPPLGPGCNQAVAAEAAAGGPESSFTSEEESSTDRNVQRIMSSAPSNAVCVISERATKYPHPAGVRLDSGAHATSAVQCVPTAAGESQGPLSGYWQHPK